MTFICHHGIKRHTGAMVQSVEVKYTQQLSKVPGMKDGKTQTLRAFEHTDENTGTVTGKGDMQISPGFGNANVSGIDGGMTHIGEVTEKETLGTEAEWSYTFTHMPHCAAA